MIGMSEEWPLTILLAGLASKTATIFLSLVLGLLFGEIATDGFSGRPDPQIEIAGLAFLALVLAPILESLVVWLTVWLLGYRIGLNWWATAFLSGLVHVPLHGLSILSLSVLPAFTLQAVILDYWTARGRSVAGYWIVVGAHAFSNLLALVAWLIL